MHNAVQANILGLTTENSSAFNQAYNVAFGERFTINQMYNAIKKYLEKTIDANHREPRAGDIRDSLADISKAEKHLNYQAQIKLEEGLKHTLDWFKT